MTNPDETQPDKQPESQPETQSETPAAPEQATASAAEPSPAAPAPAAEGSAAPVEENAPADGSEHGEGTEPQTSSSAPEAAAQGEGDGEAKPKRKRKRRRRKKKPEGDPAQGGQEAGPAKDGEGDEDGKAVGAQGKDGKEGKNKKSKKGDDKSKKGDDKKKKLPFAYLFEAGLAGRKHGYHVGTLVAGHVVLVGEGAAVINLFGKATAFVLEHEPRDAPALAGDEADKPAAGEVAPEAAAGAGDASPEASAPAVTESAEGAPADGAEAGPPASAEAAASAIETPVAPKAVGDDAPAAETAVEEPAATEATPVPLESRPAADAETSAEAQPATQAEDTDGAGDGGSVSAEDGSDAADEKGDDAGAGAEAGSTEADDASQPEKSRPEPPVFPVLEPQPPLAVGAMFRGRIGAVADSGHIAIVNRNIEVAESRARLKQAMAARSRVQGLVFGYNRGGFDVLVDGIRAFCPLRGITLDEIHDPNPFLGSMFEFLVQQVKSGKQGIVVSRRSILEREAKKRALKRIKSLEVGEVLDVRVNSIRKPGVVVEFEGGAEGIVPHNEVSWDRGKRARDVAKIGSVRKAKVIRLPERIGKTKRYTRTEFSFKALDADPWAEHESLLKEGTPAQGKIVSLMEFGAFVELAPGLQGLLHVSELGRGLKHPSDAVSAGDEVFVVVDRIDRDKRQVSLSKLSDDEAELFKKGELVLPEGGRPKLRVGGKVKVVVTKADAKGVVVQVPGVLGKKGRGFIRPGDTGTQRGTDLRKRFKEGQEIEVKIVATDRDGGLRCSIKALAVDEERQAIRSYKKKAAKQSFGKLGDLFAAELGLGKDES